MKKLRDAVCAKHAGVYTDKGCVACRLVKFRNDNAQLHRLAAYIMCQQDLPMDKSIDACIETVEQMKETIKTQAVEIDMLRELVE